MSCFEIKEIGRESADTEKLKNVKKAFLNSRESSQSFSSGF